MILVRAETYPDGNVHTPVYLLSGNRMVFLTHVSIMAFLRAGVQEVRVTLEDFYRMAQFFVGPDGEPALPIPPEYQL